MALSVMSLITSLCLWLGNCDRFSIHGTSNFGITRPDLNWTHEEGSEMMLEYLIDDNNVDIDTESVNFIKDLISGTPRSSR